MPASRSVASCCCGRWETFLQVGDMHTDQGGDVGGAGGLAQLPGPHRRTGIAP
jgi:hypothetical protein